MDGWVEVRAKQTLPQRLVHTTSRAAIQSPGWCGRDEPWQHTDEAPEPSVFIRRVRRLPRAIPPEQSHLSQPRTARPKAPARGDDARATEGSMPHNGIRTSSQHPAYAAAAAHRTRSTRAEKSLRRSYSLGCAARSFIARD
ncbi:hypothetical protein K3495_g5571 [Podosphaera aphanis]|nr:hypothetical protein K3495_g5571 [Podosphaera aphanis]